MKKICLLETAARSRTATVAASSAAGHARWFVVALLAVLAPLFVAGRAHAQSATPGNVDTSFGLPMPGANNIVNALALELTPAQLRTAAALPEVQFVYAGGEPQPVPSRTTAKPSAVPTRKV